MKELSFKLLKEQVEGYYPDRVTIDERTGCHKWNGPYKTVSDDYKKNRNTRGGAWSKP